MRGEVARGAFREESFACALLGGIGSSCDGLSGTPRAVSASLLTPGAAFARSDTRRLIAALKRTMSRFTRPRGFRLRRSAGRRRTPPW